MRTAVFAYGSLVDPASAAHTLCRPIAGAWPARLRGWRRGFTVMRDNVRCEKTFARTGDGWVPRHVIGLNLEPDRGAASPNGMLLELDEEGLVRLDRRELRYRRADVTAAVDAESGAPPFARVVTYLAAEGHHAPEPPPASAVIASYVRTVEAAFAALGPEELAEYRRTTDPPPVAVIEAKLVRDRIPPGNPRAW
jgi:cation transport regulator ChaC